MPAFVWPQVRKLFLDVSGGAVVWKAVHTDSSAGMQVCPGGERSRRLGRRCRRPMLRSADGVAAPRGL